MAEPLTDAEFAALQKLGVFVTVERAVEYIQAALAAVPRLASPVAQEAAGEREAEHRQWALEQTRKHQSPKCPDHEFLGDGLEVGCRHCIYIEGYRIGQVHAGAYHTSEEVFASLRSASPSAAPPRGGASAGGGDDEPELCPCGKGTSCLGCDAAASAGEGQG